MISYAQNCEDVLLRRAFPKQRMGFYIDIGANDPFVDSVTKHFSLEGWRGINVEPQVDLYQKICEDRPNDVNLNVGVSDRASTLEFMQCASASGLSTFVPEIAEERARTGLEFVRRIVPVTTLAEICEAHVKGPIDFLSIDVEGHEREVVSGNDWTRWRPRIVLVEATNPERWEPLLHAANYLSATFDGINLFYVRGEEPELLNAIKAPVNVLDDYIRRPMHEYVEAIRADSTNVRAYASWLEAELAGARAEAERLEQALAVAQRSAAPVKEPGPNALKLAYRLHDLSVRHPRLARTFRRALRTTSGL